MSGKNEGIINEMLNGGKSKKNNSKIVWSQKKWQKVKRLREYDYGRREGCTGMTSTEMEEQNAKTCDKKG